MSDLINREALIESLEKEQEIYENNGAIPSFWTALSVIRHAPTVKTEQWIPCDKRMPEEHESIFKKVKGTDKWDNSMFEGISDDVNVTVEYDDGTRKTITSHTLDGKWLCEKEYRIGNPKVIAWMPLPEPYKGE